MNPGISPEQQGAFALLDQVLQPSTVTSLASNGTRESWARISAAVETLRPIFAANPPATTDPTGSSD